MSTRFFFATFRTIRRTIIEVFDDDSAVMPGCITSYKISDFTDLVGPIEEKIYVAAPQLVEALCGHILFEAKEQKEEPTQKDASAYMDMMETSCEALNLLKGTSLSYGKKEEASQTWFGHRQTKKDPHQHPG